MLSRSLDRRKEERLESSRDTSWKAETKFYLSALVLSLTLYFTGSEVMVKYLEWVRSQINATVSTPPPSPPPPVQPCQQQQAALRHVQQQAKVNLQQQQINADRQIALHHPDPQERQKATRRLEQIEASSPTGVIGRDFAAAQKP